MSSLEFIESLVSSLAWPVAALVIVLMFRSELAGLFSSQMRRLKAGPVEVEWDRQLAEAEVDIDQPGVPRVSDGQPVGPIAEEFAQLARASPSAAVMEAHARVERELRRRLTEAGVSDHTLNLGAAGLARLASRQGFITPETARAIEGISVLRNLAAHGRAGEVTEDRARDYLALTDAVLFALGSPPPAE